jgi:hypothetical protein
MAAPFDKYDLTANDNALSRLGEQDPVVEHTRYPGVNEYNAQIEWSNFLRAITTDSWKVPRPDDVDYNPPIVIFEDFTQGALATETGDMWQRLSNGTTGSLDWTNDGPGGFLKLNTGGDDNDYEALATSAECFKMEDNCTLVAMARIRLNSDTTGTSAVWLGFTDTLTTGGVGTDGNPLADYDGVLMFMPEDDLTWSGEVSNGTTQDTIGTGGLFEHSDDSWFNIGFIAEAGIDESGDADEGKCRVRFYKDGTLKGTVGTDIDATGGTNNMSAMHALIGVLSDTGGATLYVDWVAFAQTRPSTQAVG